MENGSGRVPRGHRQQSAAKFSISLNQKECCVCFDSKPDAVIMECGHGGICYECGKHLLATDPNVCHLCREEISYVLKMDLSTVYSNFIKVISATFIDDELEEGPAGSGPQESQDPATSSPPTATDQQPANEIQVITDTQQDQPVATEVIRV